MNGTILKAENVLVKRGGVDVLDLPSFEVKEGEVLALIGPNGAGKSTLLLCLARLLDFQRGAIMFRGQDADGRSAIVDYRRRIAMVFQEPLLFDTDCYTNVASGLKIRGLPRGAIRKRVEEALSLFGVSHLANRSARKISGGEAQRTSLARAFAIDPEIVFLDEPFSSLDPPTRDAIIDDLDRALRAKSVTVVMATHDQNEAIRLADRIAVMKDGRIVQIGVPEEVMNRPADEFVASFVGMETIMTGRVAETNAGSFVVQVGDRRIEATGVARTGELVTLCLRPENIVISKGECAAPTSVRNAIPAVVTKITQNGFVYRVQLDCGFPLTA
ncbi:MAG: ABC transporter ATP-binding protein, partial [Smithellaceae bacterium]|nr:ABC transporter ATP-binding protein [Smithellaceae bacterium]